MQTQAASAEVPVMLQSFALGRKLVMNKGAGFELFNRAVNRTLAEAYSFNDDYGNHNTCANTGKMDCAKMALAA